MAQDDDSASDPYLKVKLGKQVLDNRAEHEQDKNDVDFCKRFDLHTTLPGVSVLTIECWDYDSFGRISDDLIGRTEVKYRP